MTPKWTGSSAQTIRWPVDPPGDEDMDLARILDTEILPWWTSPRVTSATRSTRCARTRTRSMSGWPWRSQPVRSGAGQPGHPHPVRGGQRPALGQLRAVYAPGLDMEAELRRRGCPVHPRDQVAGGRRRPARVHPAVRADLHQHPQPARPGRDLPLRTADRGENAPADLRRRARGVQPRAARSRSWTSSSSATARTRSPRSPGGAAGDTAASSGREKLEALAELEGIYVPALYPMETLPDGRCCPPVDGPSDPQADHPRSERRDVPGRLHRALHPAGPRSHQPRGAAGLHPGLPVLPGGHDHPAGPRARRWRTSTTCCQRTLDTTGYEEVSSRLPVHLRLQPGASARREHRRAGPAPAGQRVPAVAAARQLLRGAGGHGGGDPADGADGGPRGSEPAAAGGDQQVDPRRRAPRDDGAQAYERGWDHVKMYFMIGLPTERDDDIVAIADLCEADGGRRGREIHGRAKANLGCRPSCPSPSPRSSGPPRSITPRRAAAGCAAAGASAAIPGSSSVVTIRRRPSSRAW